MKITKAVFPVAGMGTRFLPATKATPKEMMPIVDKPLIQYAVEEALCAGITEMIFVTSSSKRTIEDHFDKNYELESLLEQKSKTELLEIVRNIIPSNVSCVYIRQSEALGLGHAVLCAKQVVGNSPFAVILADDLIDGNGHAVTAQIAECFDREQCSIICVEKVSQEDVSLYGIVSTSSDAKLSNIYSIVEKPDPLEAPSNLAVTGRYIFTPRIFDSLEITRCSVGGEIQLTDAIKHLLNTEQVMAYHFTGKRYDCGNKLGYLQATVEYALKHPEIQDEFRRYLLDREESGSATG